MRGKMKLRRAVVGTKSTRFYNISNPYSPCGDHSIEPRYYQKSDLRRVGTHRVHYSWDQSGFFFSAKAVIPVTDQ